MDRRLRFSAAILSAAVLGISPAGANVDVEGVPHADQVDGGGPVAFEIGYVSEVMSNVSGGIDTGTRYLNNLGAALEADLEQALGLSGTTFFISGIYNNGKSISELAGDLQVISNIEAPVEAARLYEMWLDKRMFSDQASVRVGLYDVNSEFDVLDSSALFINSAHGIGSDIGLTGENGPSIFPITSFGGRFDLALGDAAKVRFAILDGVPGDPDRLKRTAIKLGNGDGAFLIGEAEVARDGWKLLAGYWRYTGDADQFSGGTGDGNDGIYLRGEARLTSEGAGDQGLMAFGRIGRASGSYNVVETYVGAGLNYTGLIPGRDEDQLGFAVAWAEASDDLRITDPALERREVNYELTYRAPITGWLALQPDVQYVVNPGLDPGIDNALVLGLRAEVVFGF